MKLARYHIVDLAIHAHVGLYEQEKISGNDFLVNLSYSAPFESAAITDNLNDAVNYGDVCAMVEDIFLKANCNLLEQIAQLTVNTLKENFPLIQDLSVTVTKLNPPVSQAVKGISITVEG